LPASGGVWQRFNGAEKVDPVGQGLQVVPPAGRMKPAAHTGLSTEVQSTIFPAGTGVSPHVAVVKIMELPLVMSIAEAVTSKQPVTEAPMPVGPLKLAAL